MDQRASSYAIDPRPLCLLKDLKSGFVKGCVRVVHGVDMVLIDVEGTKMIACLITEAVKDRFLNCFIRDSCYEVSDFLVTDDIYGVVRYISEVRTRKDQGYEEKQLEIILQTTDRDTGDVGHIVCFLNGPWVEYVKRDFKRLGMNQHAFVVVTYVYSTTPSDIGIPIVSSYLDTTEVPIDPNYPEVQNLKLEVED